MAEPHGRARVVPLQGAPGGDATTSPSQPGTTRAEPAPGDACSEPTETKPESAAHIGGMSNNEPSRRLEPLLTTEDLAEYLQVPLKTIYDWRTNGTGPTAYKFGRHLRYRACDVEAWIADQVA